MKTFFLKLIDFYKFFIWPLKKKPCCRFYPCCSKYATEAIIKYGAFKGFFMMICRILRCNPLCKSGYDPVP